MNKKRKNVFILPIVLLVSEIINYIIMFGFRAIIITFVPEKFFTYRFFKCMDNISFVITIIVSLLIYFCVGVKIFNKIGDEKSKKYSIFI